MSVGQKFNRLTVTALVREIDASGPRFDWQCQCDCGEIIVTRARNVKSGHTMSCGCLNKERVSERHRTHGMSDKPIYLNWQTMIQRRENANNPHYHRYGGRGITVCDRWKSFEHFYADMGDPPTRKHSLDRQDNERGYSPDNCRWATARQQLLNTRRSIAKMERLSTLVRLHLNTLKMNGAKTAPVLKQAAAPAVKKYEVALALRQSANG